MAGAKKQIDEVCSGTRIRLRANYGDNEEIGVVFYYLCIYIIYFFQMSSFNERLDALRRSL